MTDFQNILENFRLGKLTADDAERRVRSLFFSDLGHTKIDADRKSRTGAGEIIFGQTKTAEQCADACRAILERQRGALITRLDERKAAFLQSKFDGCVYDPLGKIMRIGENCPASGKSHIAVITAGTSDMGVAREAEFTANFLGNRTKTYFDCGVAGIHRLLSQIDEIRTAGVVIAIAGMEGALASVVAGLVEVPVIAVPTSVGYGANFGGLSALLSMLNSCANGVSVVNIDNGFGAAYTAHLIDKKG